MEILFRSAPTVAENLAIDDAAARSAGGNRTPPAAVLVGRATGGSHGLQRAAGTGGGRRRVRQAGSRCAQTVHRRRQRAPDRWTC